ncbi:recombination mediator RecR [Lagierella massiliensis]|uniref:recombination mediator RecR n=1 Tax=Lagierella massiliensis TaxID=1689303 RepID=UPI0006D79C46|nr:recombination mediator RecR [Lagierella massiliensis]
MALYPKDMEELILKLSSLPTIGRKSARRLAFKIVEMDQDEVFDLAKTLVNVKENIKPCRVCGNITDGEICDICSDDSRDKTTIIVVEDSSNIISLEKAREYRGLYHVIGGLLSPRNEIGPENLNIDSLIERVKTGEIKEVILSLSSTTDGEFTSGLISEILKPYGVKVTKIAQGIPIGVSLDYFDEMSIYRAIEDRREI